MKKLTSWQAVAHKQAITTILAKNSFENRLKNLPMKNKKSVSCSEKSVRCVLKHITRFLGRYPSKRHYARKVS